MHMGKTAVIQLLASATSRHDGFNTSGVKFLAHPRSSAGIYGWPMNTHILETLLSKIIKKHVKTWFHSFKGNSFASLESVQSLKPWGCVWLKCR